MCRRLTRSVGRRRERLCLRVRNGEILLRVTEHSDFAGWNVILVSHDIGGQHDRAGSTLIQQSRDRGATWTQLAELRDQKWSTLFLHHGAVYLIGTTAKVGHMIIRRSSDSGRTWTTPTDARSGLLAEGKFHCAPTPVVIHHGRIWRAFEQFSSTPPVRHVQRLCHVRAGGCRFARREKLDRTNQIAHQREWLNTRNAEWLEGNAVVTPDGKIVDILRVESHPAINAPFALPGAAAKIPRFEVAAMMHISDDGRSASFDPRADYIHFIGSEAKFTIRFDSRSNRYWSIGSKITNPHSGYLWLYTPHHQRNVLSLTSSTDLREWEERYRILRFRESEVVTKAESRVGFQYVDWQFDGDDLIAVCRMAWNGVNYHDANVITFHRLKNFRTLTMAEFTASPCIGEMKCFSTWERGRPARNLAECGRDARAPRDSLRVTNSGSFELMSRIVSVFIFVLTIPFATAADVAARGKIALPHGPPPGVVIASSPDPEKAYIGTPSIAILPDDSYVAAHDFFGKNDALTDITRVYGSRDRGATWTQLSEIRGRRGSRSLFIAARSICTARRVVMAA